MDLISSQRYKNIPIFIAGRYPSYLIGENDPERMTDGVKPSVYFGNNPNISENSRFILFEKNLKVTLCQVSKNNPIYIIQPIPELGFNVSQRVVKNLYYNRSEKTSITYKSYLERSQKTREIIDRSAVKCNVKVLDPSTILCQAGQCIGEYKGRPIYHDGDHLSEYGNKLLIPMFRNAM